MTEFKFAQRLDQVGEYYFSSKLETISKMQADGHDVISLGIGSPDLVPPKHVLDAAIESVALDSSHGYATYRSTSALRNAISAWYSKTFSVNLLAESEILPLLGSKEGILYISLAILNPGDGVLIPNPGYPAYSAVAGLLGAKSYFYNLKESHSWQPDFEELENQDLTGCKMMWVNYPNMPTGKAGTAKLMSQLIDFGKRKKIMICHDNPYSLILNASAPLSILQFDDQKKYSLELNSLSKSFNMAGWRIGMLLGPKVIVDAVLQVKSNVDSGMFLPIQAGAIAALWTADSWHEGQNKIYRARQKIAKLIFDRLKFTYDADQVGLFVWAKAGNDIKDVSKFCDQILSKYYVFLTPGLVFGSNGQRFARISLCTSEARLQEALTRLEAL